MPPQSDVRLPQWNLTQLYTSESVFEKEIARLRKRVNAFAAYRDKLVHPSRALIEEILTEMEDIARMGQRIHAYAQLSFDEDTRNEQAKARLSYITQLSAELANTELFFGMWWKELEEKKIKGLLPRNRDHAFFLREARKMRRHLLSEKEEKVINLKNANGIHAMERVYSQITNGMEFPWKVGERTRMVTEEQLRHHMMGKDPASRKRAYDTLWGEYRKNSGVLGEIYRGIVLDFWNEEIKLRKFANPISVRNIANDLSNEVVETFMRVCEKNTTLFRDYFEWKARELGHPNARYHIYAPFPFSSKKWEFGESLKTVLNVFDSFSPRFASEAKRVVSQKRLDVRPAPGKRGGAYCLSVAPEEPAFILHNWMGTYHDVSTLAHEMGHAIHGQLAGEHSTFVSHAPLPLAETASIFSEMLLAEKIMEDSPTPSLRKAILSMQLQDAFASIPRQVFFTRFEQHAFEMIREGKTIPEINAEYYRLLRVQFGKKMDIPKNAQHEWMIVSHMFEHPFYTYSYAFGQLLVLALFDRYQKEGKDFVSAYTRFLSYGGSEHPEKILHEMGFFPERKKSWGKGFQLLEKKLATLRKDSR